MGADPDHHIITQLRSLMDYSTQQEQQPHQESELLAQAQANKEYLEVPCPSHDNPLLLIPKAYRAEFFDELITDKDFKHKLHSHKQYEWVFKDSPCTICQSLYQTLLDMLDSPSKVFEMVFARRYLFIEDLDRE